MPVIRRPPSLQAILEALEKDICKGLIELRERGYSMRHAEIMDALKCAKLSEDMALAFAAHMLLRFDDARRVIDNVTRFEPLIEHKLNIDRKNYQSATQPRARKGKDLRKEIKDIMRREKRRGIAFADFLANGMGSHIEGLTIKKMRTGKYKIFTENVVQTKALFLKETSLRRMFYSSKK